MLIKLQFHGGTLTIVSGFWYVMMVMTIGHAAAQL